MYRAIFQSPVSVRWKRNISRLDSADSSPVARTVCVPLLRVNAYAVWSLVTASSSMVNVTFRLIASKICRYPSAVSAP